MGHLTLLSGMFGGRRLSLRPVRHNEFGHRTLEHVEATASDVQLKGLLASNVTERRVLASVSRGADYYTAIPSGDRLLLSELWRRIGPGTRQTGVYLRRLII